MTREEAKLMAYSEEDRELEYNMYVEHIDIVIDRIYDDFETKDNSCKNKMNNPMMHTLHDLKQDKADIEAKISELLLSFANEYEVDIQEIKLHQSKWQNLDSKKLTISLNVEVVVEI